MMQAGVCLRQDTETTLPELTGQHRIRQKEQELSGLESVHMAESETECAVPGLNTLEPECVTAHSGVSDVHHTHTSVIKTEADLGSTHTGDLIKTESLDNTELGYVTHLHPGKIKTEAGDGGYLKAEHISDSEDFSGFPITSGQMKCESSGSFMRDLMNTEINGGGVDHKHRIEPRQCAGPENPNCKKEENYDQTTHCQKNENYKSRIVQKSCNEFNCQGIHVMNEPMMSNSSKNPRLSLNSNEKKTIHRKGEINMGENLYKDTQCTRSHLNTHQIISAGEKFFTCNECEKCFNTNDVLNRHMRIHTDKKKPHKCIHCGKCFSYESELSIHLRMHTGEKPYKCTQCEKCFKTKSELNIHLRIHTGEKPYKCIHCGKCFSQKSKLSIHLRIHTGEKPYECPQCEKCFKTTSQLNSHLRIHTEKPYPTNVEFTPHSGEKPHKCVEVLFPKIYFE